tara:strand:+ start:7587 stop:7985 length:399 start_codon:yes stop_codon:yes gene_type:complete
MCLLSALIRDSITRKIIIESGWDLFYPEISFKDVEKYSSVIMEKSGLDRGEYNTLFFFLVGYFTRLRQDQFSFMFDEANELIGEIDPDDVVFLALALSIECDGIWSDDAHFKRQEKVRVYTTPEIIEIFKEY